MLQAEDKKMADEIEAEEKKRADEIRMAQIKADKEPALKEVELNAQQDQASTSLAAAPPPHNKDAKSPKLLCFINEKDELDRYCYALNAMLRMQV